jgi:hypothetical protein
MSLLPSFTKACDDLRGRPWRDADEHMDRDDVMGTELGILVRSFETLTSDRADRQLAWLSFFAARRALPCWDLYCDEAGPHRTVDVVQNWLLTGIPPKSWETYKGCAKPKFKGKAIIDCREADTSCAAASAAHAARFASTHDSFHAVCGLSAAHMEFDQSPLGSREDFDRWLLDVAVPAAYDCRELSVKEQFAFRTYNDEQIRLQREEGA